MFTNDEMQEHFIFPLLKCLETNSQIVFLYSSAILWDNIAILIDSLRKVGFNLLQQICKIPYKLK